MHYRTGKMFLANMLAFYDPFINESWHEQYNDNKNQSVHSMAEAIENYGFAWGDVTTEFEYI